MIYTSFAWLAWIWITVSLYWLAPRSWRDLLLMALSLAALISVAPLSAALLLACLAITHVAGNVAAPRAAVVALGGGSIALLLIGFKLGSQVGGTMLINAVLVPLGLSYYSFRCIHFLIERHKGRIAPMPLRSLAAYLLFLPTFLVGPIHRFDTFHADQQRQRLDPGLMARGVERIIHGYAKIIILGNFGTGQVLGGAIAALPDQQGAAALYLGIVQNGLNLYFQFAGHSDIAIGFGLMLGFRIMENFRWPYLQPNLSAFWQSWHRSLSRWCRDYIYGVVVAHTRSPALGALSTMVIIGLWHEISLRFVLWGAWHGVGLIVWQRWQDVKAARGLTLAPAARAPVHALSVVFTVHYVWFGFVILTAPSAAEALAQFGRLFAALLA